MPRHKLPLLLLLPLLATCRDSSAPVTEPKPPNSQSVSVLTQHNDNNRSGLNDNETALTTTNVNAQQFGEVFTVTVDDQVYAQPLVVGHVAIGGGYHNVVFAATVNNTVYAFDGDNGTLYWQKNFTAPGMRPPQRFDMTGACSGSYTDFSGNIGIVGTPVIDAGTGRMYFVARSTSGGTGATFVQYLHAVNIVDGSEVLGGRPTPRSGWRGCSRCRPRDPVRRSRCSAIASKPRRGCGRREGRGARDEGRGTRDEEEGRKRKARGDSPG
jgi:hypothetical protein